MAADKKIIMPLGERQKLARDFGVSLPTVRSALNGITRSELAKHIRAEALRRGGEVYQKVPSPDDRHDNGRTGRKDEK